METPVATEAAGLPTSSGRRDLLIRPVLVLVTALIPCWRSRSCVLTVSGGSLGRGRRRRLYPTDLGAGWRLTALDMHAPDGEFGVSRVEGMCPKRFRTRLNCFPVHVVDTR